jgi:3-hydroxy-3-methylglutaryl CoA synthase
LFAEQRRADRREADEQRREDRRAAEERDALAAAALSARDEAERIAYDTRLKQEATNRLFEQLEDAVTLSMAPLDKMFTDAGLDPDRILLVRYAAEGLANASSYDSRVVSEDLPRALPLLLGMTDGSH